MEITVTNFVHLDTQQLTEILAWRNDHSVRSVSRNTHIISLDEHLAFVDKLQTDQFNKYYRILLTTDHTFAHGAIFFNDITAGDQAEIGLYKRADSTLKGAGTIMLDMIILLARQMQLKTLRLCVAKNNAKALSLYRKFGVEPIGEENGFLTMKLSIQRA